MPRSSGERPKAVVHVDLDGLRHIYTIHGWTPRGDDDPLFETGLSHALDFFAEHGVRAMLFAIAEDLENPRKRPLLERAVAEGHEIGSHSVSHRNLDELPSEEKRAEVFESKELLERALGCEVRGFRAPGFALDREVLELVDEAGYVFDSSVMPKAKVTQKVGVDHSEWHPHAPLAGRKLTELPVPYHRRLGVPFHPCYSLVMGSWLFRSGVRSFRKTGAPLMLLFHLTDFAEPLPKERLDGWKTKFFTVSFLSAQKKRARCARMLAFLRDRYEVVPTSDLLR